MIEAVSEENVTVGVKILDKEFRIACKPDDRERLLASAELVDEKMREVRRSGKVLGTERVAVMVALNLAHELLDQREKKDVQDTQGLSERIRNLQQRVENILDETRRLEL